MGGCKEKISLQNKNSTLTELQDLCSNSRGWLCLNHVRRSLVAISQTCPLRMCARGNGIPRSQLCLGFYMLLWTRGLSKKWPRKPCERIYLEFCCCGVSTARKESDGIGSQVASPHTNTLESVLRVSKPGRQSRHSESTMGRLCHCSSDVA